MKSPGESLRNLIVESSRERDFAACDPRASVFSLVDASQLLEDVQSLETALPASLVFMCVLHDFIRWSVSCLAIRGVSTFG